MNVTALSNAQSPFATSSLNGSQTTSATLWSQLGKSLKSGNLAGAQAAFATIKQNYEQNHVAGAGSGTPTGPLVSDIKQLSQALQSGNLSDAQSAFATLSQDAKAQGIYGTASSQAASNTAALPGGSLSVLA